MDLLNLCKNPQWNDERRICCFLNVLVWTAVNSSETQKNMWTSEGFHNYKLVIMTAWAQSSAPVWVSHKQKQQDRIIRSRTLQRFFPPAQSELMWEVLSLSGEVQKKHAVGQALPSSPLFNLITVMSLETAGCTTTNVDADKRAALSHSLTYWLSLAAKCKVNHQAQSYSS